MKTNAKLEVYNRCFLVKVSDSKLFGSEEKIEPENKPDFLNIEYEISKENNYPDNYKNDLQDKDLTSVYRSKRSVQEIIKLNDWDYFVTFTFKERDLSNEKLLDKALNRIKYLLKKNAIFGYCLVPELQKSGILHFHGFLKCDDSYMILSDCVKVYGVEKPVKSSTYKNRYAGKPFENVYNFSAWNLGFSVCYKVNNDLDKLLVYMIKYILKSSNQSVFDKERARRYFAGGDIHRDLKSFEFYIDELIFDTGELNPVFEDFKFYSSPFGYIGYLQIPFDNSELIQKYDKYFILKDRLIT